MNKVQFETAGPLGILTLANPPLNLLSGELIEDLRATVSEVKRAPLRALLVRAAGKIFSAGADVSAFKDKTGREARERFTTHLRMIADLEELPFPTLAYAAGKRMVRAFLEGGVRAADKVVDEVAPPLFQSEDMRAGVAALVEHGARNFRDKVIFQGR